MDVNEELTCGHHRSLERKTASGFVCAFCEALRALHYALPLVKSYAHTQGDNAAYHAELVRPIERALECK